MLANRWVLLSLGLLCSLSLHLLFFGGLVWFAPLFENKKSEPIEVTLDPEGQILNALTPKKTVVRQPLVPEKIKAPDDETLARFFSEQKQRVKEETQAAHTGMTANRANQAGPSSPAKKIENDKDGYQKLDISKELQEMNRFNEGFSTVGESLPKDMKVGSFTALNTDRYLFYTFYARIEELVRHRWESRVQQAIDSFDRTTLNQAGNRNWVTNAEFLLDKDGVLRKALLMKESGITPFDAAAIRAFQDAKIFPNPPPEMIQEDGFIHIKFSFTVNYSPPTLVNRN